MVEPTTIVEGAAEPRRIIRPKYEFDPNASYADPIVQEWATYYARGGTDPAGTVHFVSTPVGDDQVNDEKNATQSRPALTIDTNVPGPSTPRPQFARADSDDFQYLRNTYGILDCHPINDVIVKYDFEPTRADELAAKSGAMICVVHRFQDGWALVKNVEGKRGIVPSSCLHLEKWSDILRSPTPRTPSSFSRLAPIRSPISTTFTRKLSDAASKRKSRMLGLLELFHVSKRNNGENHHAKFSLPSPSMITPFQLDSDQKPRSVLKKSLSLKGKKARRVRFDASLTEEFSYENDSDTASLIALYPAPNGSREAEFEFEGDDDDDSPRSLPPSYDEVFSPLRPLPIVPTGPLSSCPEDSLKTQHTNFASDSKSDGEHTNFVLGSKPDGEEKVPVEVLVEPVSPLAPLDPSITNPAIVPSAPSLLPGAVASENIIYKDLLSVLMNKVSYTDPLRTTLHEYIATLRSLDPVSSLLQSRNYRLNLLNVASALNISEDPAIRVALQKDEYKIAVLLEGISHSEESKRAVLQLEGDDAQKFLDVVQDVLDKAYFLNHEDNARARRLLVRLSETCDKLPSSLFIKGVGRADSQATFGGGFGDVYRATYNHQCVALKRMRIFQRDPGLPNTRRRFCKEALIWQQLKSPFVVPFLGIDAETFPSFLCMVSPWMRHGTVLKHLADHNRNGVDKRLHEIAQGLSYLHSQKIVHGDLRGSNVLINDEWQACLTDFGLTVFDDATAVTFTSRREGSVRWMAPELHDHDSFGLDRFRLTPETDIYAFGCVCLELYTGRPPFSDIRHDATVILKVIQGGRPSRPVGEGQMSDQFWKMVEMCWSQHFADRLKTEEVVEFTKKLSDPNTKCLDLPVFSEVPRSLLVSDDDDQEKREEEESSPPELTSAEDIVVKKSLANARYLQGDLSLPPGSLFVPEVDDMESPLTTVCEDENRSETPRLLLALPLRKSSLSMTPPAPPPVAADLPEELEGYWGIMDQLDQVLDTDFSLTLDYKPTVRVSEAHPPIAHSAVVENDLELETSEVVIDPHLPRSIVFRVLVILLSLAFAILASFVA